MNASNRRAKVNRVWHLGWTMIFPLLGGLLLWLNPPAPTYADLEEEFTWASADGDDTNSVAWADVDGDGDLDLTVGNDYAPNKVYLNQGGMLATEAGWVSADANNTNSVAWGDVDGDGDLDLAVGNDYAPNKVYLNQGRMLATEAGWASADSAYTNSVAWGDVDGDGDLDLAVGNAYSPNKVYLNQGGTLSTTAGWVSTDSDNTKSVAWGDVDGDGDLDLAVGNFDDPNKIYLNQGGALSTTAGWASDNNENITNSVAWGDVDGDGDLDLAAGDGEANKVYLNQGGMLSTTAGWISADDDETYSVAWGDVDGDGDLDLVAGNPLYYTSKVYLNQGGMLATEAGWTSADNYDTRGVAWGDVDGDGNLDLAAGNGSGDPNKVYLNQGGALTTETDWAEAESGHTMSVAWGDVDGDGDLDLAAGTTGSYPSRVHLNQGGTLSTTAGWVSADDSDWTYSVAWGDVDGDGDLDLAVGNNYVPNKVYFNQGEVLSTTAGWVSAESDNTKSVAWGDVDGDGDLDLAVGNDYTPNKVYLNQGGGLETTAGWVSAESDNTKSVAWGDVDGDGDLDLAVGNGYAPNKVYLNQRGALDTTAGWVSADFEYTSSIAWGDVDGDGDLDLAAGNNRAPNKVYLNQGGGLDTTAGWVSADFEHTGSIAWGDVDGDGDLDLACGGRVYTNEDGTLTARVGWASADFEYTSSIAWGDVDGDGDLDLAGVRKVYFNQYVPPMFNNTAFSSAATVKLQSNPASTFAGTAVDLAPANFYALPGIRQGIIPISYTLFHPSSQPSGLVKAYYSLDGGGNWQVAVPTTDTITIDLAQSPFPTATLTNTHVFYWDTFASGLFGQSDNVVLRFEVFPNYTPINGAPLFQRPYIATQTYPFRVRGAMVRVFSQTVALDNAAANAIVYRLPKGRVNFEPMDSAGQLFRTNGQGYLEGRGELGIGDQLVALLPITSTNSYTLYQTSAAADATGFADAFTVTVPGVQTLIVSADNQLAVFDLSVSLEWDARNDPGFLLQLENDLQRTAQILYDLTNGQATLGKVRVYHAREQWNQADIVIHASNSVRPGAIAGGIVVTGTHDIGVTGVITNAYVPGQVRMGSTWNRFGDPGGVLGEDWPRTLAHELGHYLMFLPDNYLGINPSSGLLTFVDCVGSAMSNPYSAGYSEFLTASEWNGTCVNTLAEVYMGRSDWETINTFYPTLNSANINDGPNNLPLAVTEIEFVEPLTPTATLDDPFFNIIDSGGSPAPIASGRGQGVLIKAVNDGDPSNDYVQELGSPIGDLIQVRGAEPGDRLCVYDFSQEPLRFGCVDNIGDFPTPVMLEGVADWMPDVMVTEVTSRSFAITVTNVSEDALMVQLYPTFGSASGAEPMSASGSDFVRTVALPEPAFAGYARVWVPDSNPPKEMVVDFISIEDWGGKALSWGGKALSWGGKALSWGGKALSWGAPTMSVDGQISIYDLTNPFANETIYNLQRLTFLPDLPIWLTPIGQAYRVSIDGTLPPSSILFRYLGRDIDGVYENDMAIYHSADEGMTWQRLATYVDMEHNHAAAEAPSAGVYVLAVTIESAVLYQGWNNVAYIVQTTRPVTEALASIDGSYTSVYWRDDANVDTWLLHDSTVASPFDDLVNTLDWIGPDAYWIYATEPVTWYVGIETAPGSRAPESLSFSFPPATYYGWIAPISGMAVGSVVTARIDGNLCGQTTVVENMGQLAYSIQVRAENPFDTNGCGMAERMIVFDVDGVVTGATTWDNAQAHFMPLNSVPTAIEMSKMGTAAAILPTAMAIALLSLLGVVTYQRRRVVM